MANLVGQIVIVVTGGAVRLTASGLGCSSWPMCEPGHFTPTLHDAASYHPFVEFGNRTLTGVLVVLAVAVALLAGLDATRSVAYRVLAWVPIAGVLVQAVVGGMAVRYELPPAVVGSHMLISMALVAASAWLWVRSREGDRPPVWLVTKATRVLATVLAVVAGVVVVLGVVTTGAGPHSGDDEVGYRFALDPLLAARVHAGFVWVFLALLALAIYQIQVRARHAAAQRPDLGYERADGTHQAVRGVAPLPPPPDYAVPLRAGYWLLGVTLLQGLVGYVQVATGLPVALVNLHMLGAALLVAFLTLFLGALRRRGLSPERATAEGVVGLPDAAAA
jgi:cytochrome c oxidase assembly protein subunit 15